jgi:hypothetical protein
MFCCFSRILVKYALSDCFELLNALEVYESILACGSLCIAIGLIPTDYGSSRFTLSIGGYNCWDPGVCVRACTCIVATKRENHRSRACPGRSAAPPGSALFSGKARLDRLICLPKRCCRLNVFVQREPSSCCYVTVRVLSHLLVLTADTGPTPRCWFFTLLHGMQPGKHRVGHCLFCLPINELSG